MDIWKKEYLRIFKETLLYRKKLYLILTPEHGNYGDHAIALAEIQFINRILPDFKIIEIQADILYGNVEKFRVFLNHQLIFITGGGFLGSLWPRENTSMMEVIRCCKKSRIIVMPQTAFFEDDRSYKECKQIIEEHKHISLFLRDKQSYNIMKEMLPHKAVYLCPDIVTILEFDVKASKKDNIMICIRPDTDKERLAETKKCQDFFKDRTEYKGIKVIYGSTNVKLKKRISVERHKQKVYMKLREIARCKLVITDRLHAMLFCAITGTSCIALENISGKIKGGYNWLSELGYIHYASDFKTALGIMEQIDFDITNKYVNYNDSKFDKLRDVIKDYTKIARRCG